MSAEPLTEQECVDLAALPNSPHLGVGGEYLRRVIATIADLRAKLAEAERERDEARRNAEIERVARHRLDMDIAIRDGAPLYQELRRRADNEGNRAESAEAKVRALREALKAWDWWDTDKGVPYGDSSQSRTASYMSLAQVSEELRSKARALTKAALRGKEGDRA